MRGRLRATGAKRSAFLCFACCTLVWALPQERREAAQGAKAAAARAVDYLSREVPAWSQNNGCFSCHNDGDAARALYAAMQRGYAVPKAALAATTAWVSRPGNWEQNKGDPGFSDKKLANLQFAASLHAAFAAGQVKEKLPLEQAAAKLTADQSADGAWHIEPDTALGSPATWGSVLATAMALQLLRAVSSPEAAAAARRAERWLRQVRPNSVPAAATLLTEAVRATDAPAAQRQEECLGLLRRAQTRDGGWGPYPDSPPEAFDTALALLALAEARRQPGVEEMIRRGRGFLIAQQNADGSWTESTRPAGGESYAQRLSTTGWATLALLATGGQ